MDNFLNGKLVNILSKQVNSINFSNQTCPDQHVADINYDVRNQRWQFLNNSIHTSTIGRIPINYSVPYVNDVILIILESPHKDEFDSSGNPIGPALGNTGKFFENEFINILNSNSSLLLPSLDKNKNYEIIFLNAVQFQTSQGLSMTKNKANKMNRDLNWLYFWNQGFESDLIKRINYFTSEKFILNLCTIGYRDLQSYISRTLISNSIKFHIGQHPSIWNITGNQIIH